MSDQVMDEFSKWLFDIKAPINIGPFGEIVLKCMYEAWLGAKEQYEAKPQVPVGPWPILLEPGDIEHIAYQAGMEAKAMDGSVPCAATLSVGWSQDDDGIKSYGLHVYCDECPEEGVILLARFDSPTTQPQVPEGEILKVIDEPDAWEALATEIAEAVGKHFSVDVGEHSSANCPVRKALEILGERQPQVPEWISTSDRLPLESDGEVLVVMKDGQYEVAWASYWHGASSEFACWSFRDPDENRHPTHWMPLPDRPLSAAKEES